MRRALLLTAAAMVAVLIATTTPAPASNPRVEALRVKLEQARSEATCQEQRAEALEVRWKAYATATQSLVLAIARHAADVDEPDTVEDLVRRLTAAEEELQAAFNAAPALLPCR